MGLQQWPFAAVAVVPPSFTSFGAAETWPAAQKARFQAYAYQLVNYIVQQSINAGVPSVVFEVSNEIDIEDSAPQNFNPSNMSQATLLPLGPYGRWLWWIDPNSYTMTSWLAANSHPYSSTGLGYPYNADVRRLDHGYSPVYQIFAQAVDQVSQISAANIPLINIRTLTSRSPLLARPRRTSVLRHILPPFRPWRRTSSIRS